MIFKIEDSLKNPSEANRNTQPVSFTVVQRNTAGQEHLVISSGQLTLFATPPLLTEEFLLFELSQSGSDITGEDTILDLSF